VAAVLVATAVVALSAIAVSSYAHATHHRVRVHITFGEVIVRAYLNCRLVREYISQADSKDLDLGWLRPKDIVSVEVTSTLTSGHVRIKRRIDDEGWKTLKRVGSLGHGTVFPAGQLVIATTFLAGGTSLGAGDPLRTPAQQVTARHRQGLPSCRVDPIWDFGPAPTEDPGTPPEGPNDVYNIAHSISTALPWILGFVGTMALLGAFVVTARKSIGPRWVNWALAVANLALVLLLWLAGKGLATALALAAVSGLVSISLFIVWLRQPPSPSEASSDSTTASE
jgi:nitrate reductase gamma subunit